MRLDAEIRNAESAVMCLMKCKPGNYSFGFNSSEAEFMQ